MKQNTLIDAMDAMGIDMLADIHTTTIAKVTKVNTKTLNAKPIINRIVDGVSIELPEFAEVPIIHLHGGASSIRMPIAIGDYCLLLISERCIDDWYFGKDNIEPREYRMHDYSDAIALVGIYNQGGELTNVTKTTIIGDVNMTGNLAIIGNITVTGDVTVSGTITGQIDVIGGGISLKNHTHSGVTAGTARTGTPQ